MVRGKEVGNAGAIPIEPGTYVLVLRCDRARTVRIGRTGGVLLRPGYYFYIGSAFGPGGLRARIAHHARRAVRPHWHVDYLRRHTLLEAVWYRPGARCEHQWAAAIGGAAGAAVVMPGLGSSDCRCRTHLFQFAFADILYTGRRVPVEERGARNPANGQNV
ncbi:MAG: GIY-YIG nuclease family protein [Acidobacteria bacterium]|nr:GIY-YIG nuclease family protein [Acidobacteriota bacterium]